MEEENEALVELTKMTDDEFQSFFEILPPRAKLGLNGGLVSWQEICPGYLVEFKRNGTWPRVYED